MDKTVRNLLFLAAALAFISVTSFFLKESRNPTSPFNPDDYFTHDKKGVSNIKTPAIVTICGEKTIMIEPGDDGSATIFVGPRIEERLNEIPNTLIIVTEINQANGGVSCDPSHGQGPEVDMSPPVPSFPQAVPEGHRWSA